MKDGTMEHLWVNVYLFCFPLGMMDDFIHSCGKSKLLDGKPPHIMMGVGVEFEDDKLDHLLVPEQDQDHSLLFGDNHFEG